MDMGFWGKLKKPFSVLAPMEGVTDTVFRQVIMSVARPDVFFTEFTSVNGMCSPGLEKVAERLKYAESEKPIVAQIWGTDPELFYKAGRMVSEMKFDGIDINMGCPVRDVVRQGGGSALIGKMSQVREIISATIDGAGRLPVSVKTRIGRQKIETEEWIGFLLGQQLAAVTIHARTAAEMSKVPAHREEVKIAVGLKKQIKSPTLIIGNGDIKSIYDSRLMIYESGVDGVMIGRGIFENPAAFDRSGKILPATERLDLLLKHLDLFEKQRDAFYKPFAEFRKFIKIYANGFSGAAGLRQKLMAAETAAAVRKIVIGIRGS